MRNTQIINIMRGFKDFIREICQAEGLAPEGLFIFLLTILFMVLVFTREYYKYELPPRFLAANLNRTAWLFTAMATFTYLALLFLAGPMFDSP